MAITYLIDQGADLNFIRKNGQNLLHIAAEKDNLPIFELIHKAGVDCNAKTKEGFTALSFASNQHKYDIMQYITKECILVGENSVEES